MSFTFTQRPFLSPLLGDEEIEVIFSIEAELSAMLQFERDLAFCQAKLGIILAAASKAIAKATESYEPDLEGLAKGTARDGLIVPEFVKQMRGQIGEEW